MICRPFHATQNKVGIRRMIALCWITSFITAIPQLFIFEEKVITGTTTRHRCVSTGYTAEWQRRVYFTIFASYVLFIPVLCMTYWYIRIIRVVGTSIKVWASKRRAQSLTSPLPPSASPVKMKTTKLALLIILVFVICWTPYMVITLIEVYSNRRFRPPAWFDGVLQAICLLQSGLNPLIYMTFNYERKYSPILILAAASTMSQKADRRYQERRARGRSISFASMGDYSQRKKRSTHLMT